MIVPSKKLLTPGQVDAVEILLFELGNNVREVVRVIHHVTGFAYRKILKEINEYFGDRIRKRRSDLQVETNKKMSQGIAEAKRLEKERKQEMIEGKKRAERLGMIDSHKNKLLTMKW